MPHSPALPSAELLARFAPLAPLEPGSALRLHLAADVFGLWEAWEREAGRPQPVPYWAVPWPAAIALCRWLGTDPTPVRGKRVLDLGCGGAAAGLAAALAGAAAVTANDIDPVALHLARCNAGANRLDLALDARDLTHDADPPADVILVGDLFYERQSSLRLLDALRAWVGRGAVVLVADAGRPFAPTTGVESLAVEMVTVNPDLEGVPTRRVRVQRLLAV